MVVIHRRSLNPYHLLDTGELLARSEAADQFEAAARAGKVKPGRYASAWPLTLAAAPLSEAEFERLVAGADYLHAVEVLP